MLFKGLDKLKRDAIMAAIILMIIGILFIIIPSDYISFVGGTIGFALLVICAASVFDFVGSAKALIHYIKLAAGLLIGLIGIELFIFEELFIMTLSWLVGTIPIILGIIEILYAVIFAKRSNRRGWWVLVILSSLLVLFGIFVFVNPWIKGAQVFMQVIGGSLLYSSMIYLLSLIWIWPMHRE